MTEIMQRFFTNTNIRSILAIIVTVLVFSVILYMAKDGHITVDEMGLISAITPLEIIVLSYYFGSSKNEADRTEAKKHTTP